MINLPVDEAYALDYLSILYVKRDKGMPVGDEIFRVETALRSQVQNFDAVMTSHEFFILLKANQSTFDRVASCGMTPVQKANYCRFQAKQAIQRKFWPDVKLQEKKRKGGV